MSRSARIGPTSSRSSGVDTSQRIDRRTQQILTCRPVVVDGGAADVRDLRDVGVGDRSGPVGDEQVRRRFDHGRARALDPGVVAAGHADRLGGSGWMEAVVIVSGVRTAVCRLTPFGQCRCDCTFYWSECPIMNMTSTSPPDASGQPDDSGRPYEPTHGAPHIPIEVPDSAWGKLGRFGFRRRWCVLGAWVTALVTVFALVGAIGASSDSSFSIPDSESKSGFDTLDAYFGGAGSGRSGTIIFRADQGVDDPEVQAAMTELFDRGRPDRRRHGHQPVLATGSDPGTDRHRGTASPVRSPTPRSTSPRTSARPRPARSVRRSPS